MNCCWSFSSVWHFCLLYPGRLCRKVLLQPKHWHCIRQVLSWAMEPPGSCLSPQQMERGGEYQRRWCCTLQRFACPTSNLASGYRTTRAALWVWREEEDSKEGGRSGNRKTIRKLPGNQVFSSSWAKINEKSKFLPDTEMAGGDEHTHPFSAYNPFQRAP